MMDVYDSTLFAFVVYSECHFYHDLIIDADFSSHGSYMLQLAAYSQSDCDGYDVFATIVQVLLSWCSIKFERFVISGIEVMVAQLIRHHLRRPHLIFPHRTQRSDALHLDPLSQALYQQHESQVYPELRLRSCAIHASHLYYE